MHDNIDPNTKAFGFVNKDADDLYKAVLVITDENFQNDLVNLMLPQTTGEARAHAAGRVSAFNDILRLFQANRDYMMKVTMREKQSNPNQSVSQP
jgi:hypothetical protein